MGILSIPSIVVPIEIIKTKSQYKKDRPRMTLMRRINTDNFYIRNVGHDLSAGEMASSLVSFPARPGIHLRFFR
jgi:hypothetical protein